MTARTRLVLVVLAGLSSRLLFPGPASAGASLALVGGRIDATPDGPPLDDGVVLIEGSRIVAVGTRRSTSVPAGATVLDCTGRVVTSGFQDSHVHFTAPSWNDAASQPPTALTAKLEAMLTRYGFTTVVDTASFLENTLSLRRRVESGEVQGPRILTAGAAL